MDEIKIPKATARRLPLYYRYLIFLNDEGKEKVSSTELAEAVQVDSASIRRDFSYFGALGKRGYGYDAVSYTHQTLPTKLTRCRSRRSPYQ